MRKPKGKLVALLAGVVAVPLLTLAVLFWKDVYCHLFLDPRLVGRWEGQIQRFPLLDFRHVIHAFQSVIRFDRIGNVRSTETSWVASRPSTEPTGIVSVGTYRTDGNTFTAVWPDRVWSEVYRVDGYTLTLFGSSGSEQTYRRVPDDS